MGKVPLVHDPYNMIITGVGGQGNVTASQVLGNMMSREDLYVTIGETFGASQRGGSVMSHLRVSSETSWSPQIPRGRAHMIMALEPIEALRVLVDYGSPETKVLCNSRPIYPVGVIAGDMEYPSQPDLRTYLEELTEAVWIVDATDAALRLGDPILGNIVMIGALERVGELPIRREDFKSVIAQILTADKIDMNLKAYDRGTELMRN